MPWQPDNQRIELIIENHGTAKKPKYKIGQFVRRTTKTGDVYLEPLANAWAVRLLVFDDIDVVQAPSIRRDAGAGELSLTGQSNSANFGGRK